MIDWLKLEIRHPKPIELLNRLDFMRPVNIRTGEVKPTFETAFIRLNKQQDSAIRVRLYPSGRLWITGSLHKFWHGVNYTDFTFLDLQKAISHICNVIEITPDKCSILQMEYGINLKVPFAPKEFLSRLICLKYRPFNLMKVLNGDGREYYLTEWGAKVYDKSKQYNLEYPVLRIEKKVTKARYFQKMGVHTLADLTQANLKTLGADLIDMVSIMLLNDKSIKEDSLTGRQRLALANYRNPNYWTVLTRFAAPKARQRFEQLISHFGNEYYLKSVKELTEIMIKHLVASGNNFTVIKTLVYHGKDPPINDEIKPIRAATISQFR